MELSDVQAERPMQFTTSVRISSTQSQHSGVLQTISNEYPRIVGILVGVLHIGFGTFLAIVTRHLETFTIYSGLPFFGGIIFIVSGSLSIAAYKRRNSCLVQSSLWMHIVGTVTAAGVILANSADIHILKNQGFEAILLEILTLLLTSAVIGFCIAVLASCFGCLCHNSPSRRPEVSMEIVMITNIDNIQHDSDHKGDSSG
uniref:Membrane-spanning 4-domains subfamily A member 15-like isoform X2 n=1 Tax=Geotrypetes seraphini TaxID=260995 RepID=A0A6P8PPA0_GEOSA|nr:membrane-spanning 4-domains subfamily A member 15-like isoform X2 [Geotrypetes seraphini]